MRTRGQATMNLSFAKRNPRERKAQAAMEFLMTYGWAIMVVMIILGSLYAMGVFSPSVPNSCKIDSPFNCVDVKAERVGGVITFAMSSSAVETVDSFTIKNGQTVCQPNPDFAGIKSALEKSDEVQQLIRFDRCGQYQKGESVKGTIEIVWRTSGTLGHTSSGTFYAKVQ